LTKFDFSKLAERWRRERDERVAYSADLRRRLIDRGLPVLRRYGVREVWLFGSAAGGTAHARSDLDLLAVPVTAEAYWPLRRELEEAVACTLDLYTQDDDPVFVRKVVERGELIYGSGKSIRPRI
jgi:predicted nucleotidyltransferase